ncbi:uncharacterized protein K460DRAFT_249164, partial [Cucurbitaria berberidis CBS 394.84]
YHPMDDSIRPSQAAKRRSVHGEKQLLADFPSSFFSEHTDREVDSPTQVDHESEPEEAPRKVAMGKKRKRSHFQSPGPTRRSSRKTSDPKTAYNMSIHPQDEDLKLLSTNDSEVDIPAHGRRKFQRTAEPLLDDRVFKSASSQHQRHAQVLDLTGSNYIDGEDDRGFEIDIETTRKETIVLDSSLPVSLFANPQPHGIRRKEGLDVWKLLPGDRYFRHDRDSWPVSDAQSFEIFEECLEDQLAAEAMALSPLDYEHDDKENNSNGLDVDLTLDPLEEISVRSASQYRRSSEDSQVSGQTALVNHALYDTSGERLQSYGLGGSDGTHDEQAGTGETSTLAGYMRVIRPGSQLLQAP